MATEVELKAAKEHQAHGCLSDLKGTYLGPVRQQKDLAKFFNIEETKKSIKGRERFLEDTKERLAGKHLKMWTATGLSAAFFACAGWGGFSFVSTLSENPDFKKEAMTKCTFVPNREECVSKEKKQIILRERSAAIVMSLAGFGFGILVLGSALRARQAGRKLRLKLGNIERGRDILNGNLVILEQTVARPVPSIPTLIPPSSTR